MSKPLKLTPTLSAHGRRIGRPRKSPPADAAKRIREAASKGASIIGIANALGVCKDVFKSWLKETPEFQEAMETGREKERSELHTGLYDAAKKGNIIAAMFLLKARHGYREGDPGDQGNRVNVTFNIPGPMSREDFMKTVVKNDE